MANQWPSDTLIKWNRTRREVYFQLQQIRNESLTKTCAGYKMLLFAKFKDSFTSFGIALQECRYSFHSQSQQKKVKSNENPNGVLSYLETFIST